MAKKDIDVAEEVAEVAATFAPIADDFGREDLNRLRDAVNFLLTR